MGAIIKKKFKISENYVHSVGEDGKVNIIHLGDDENLYVLEKVSAEIFPRIIEGEELESISKSLQEKENAPSKEEINTFLDTFVKDLLDLNIIEEKP